MPKFTLRVDCLSRPDLIPTLTEWFIDQALRPVSEERTDYDRNLVIEVHRCDGLNLVLISAHTILLCVVVDIADRNRALMFKIAFNDIIETTVFS